VSRRRGRAGNGPFRLAAPQHDPPHQSTGDAIDAGEQFDPARAAAEAVVAHLGEKVTDRPAVYQVGA
jgi:hypothetical protein